MESKTNMNRRKFLQKLGLGASSALTLLAMNKMNILGCGFERSGSKSSDDEPGEMTYRIQNGSGEKISLLRNACESG